jgi:hypothetical protein
MDCERIAEYSPTGGPESWAQSERAIRGFAEILLRHNLLATLFITPETAVQHEAMFLELEKQGFELGMHLHPQSFRDNTRDEHLGGYAYEDQVEILSQAQDDWADAFGKRATSFRPGHFSANDSTFKALYDTGFRQGSVSPPERLIPHLRAVWLGADPDAHHAHPCFRLIPGDLDFLEVPMTIDPDRRILNGETALEFRIEWGSAEDHLATVDKRVADLVAREVELKTLVCITHNMYEFEDENDPHRQTLAAVAESIWEAGDKGGLKLVAQTLAGIHQVFDSV